MGSGASHGPWHTSSQASKVIWRPQRIGGLTAEISLEAREKTERTKDTRGLGRWWMQGHWRSVPDIATLCQTLPLSGNWQWPQEIQQTRTDAPGSTSMTLTQFSVSPTSLAPHSLATVFAKKTLNQIPFTQLAKYFRSAKLARSYCSNMGPYISIYIIGFPSLTVLESRLA